MRSNALKAVGAFASILLLGACAIQQQVTPVQAVPELQVKSVCIVDSPAVRATFREALERALKERGYAVTVVPAGGATADCPAVVTYTAKWSWDLRIYMSYAKIDVAVAGKPVGEAIYDSRSGSGNFSKFINAEEKVKELVAQLFPE